MTREKAVDLMVKLVVLPDHLVETGGKLRLGVPGVARLRTGAAKEYARLKAEGKLEEATHLAAVAAQKRIESLMKAGYPKYAAATFGRKTGIALDHAVLHFDGAANGIDDASELDENAIARPLNDAAMM
jgi:hypothetical protein